MPTITIGENTTNDHTGLSEMTYISAARGATTTNYESSDLMRIRGIITTSADTRRRSLFRFDISSLGLPVGSTVTAGNIRMWQNGVQAGEQTIYVHKCLRAWVIDQVTFNEYATSTSWQTAGAEGALDADGTLETTTTELLHGVADVDNEDHDLVLLTGNAAFVTYLQAQLDSGEINLIASASVNTTSKYETEDGDDGFRPQLEITYDLPASGGSGSPGWAFSAAVAKRRMLMRGGF